MHIFQGGWGWGVKWENPEANAENSSLGLYDIKVLVMDTTEKVVCDIDVQNENLKEKVEEISCTDNSVKIDNAIINRECEADKDVVTSYVSTDEKNNECVRLRVQV